MLLQRSLSCSTFLSLAALALAVTGCAETAFNSNQQGNDAGGSQIGPCVAGADYDEDGIADEVEGCGHEMRDSDNDGIPNYADRDSDGDGIPDVAETAADIDGDGVGNYLDNDSDGDGIDDGDEDLNGDGLLGCCLTKCGEQRSGCPAVAGGACGAGQTCSNGGCSAPAFLCANGESDPTEQNTFPGAVPDNQLPTFICHKPDEQNMKGLKPIIFHVSTAGDWKLGLEADSTYGEIKIDGPTAMEAGASFDLVASDQNVAGFIVSRLAGNGSVDTVAASAIAAITGNLPGKSQVVQLSSGTSLTSHDGFPTVVSVNLAVKMASAQKPGAVRNGVFSALLGKSATQLPLDDFGPATTDHILRMQVLLRKDGRVLVMGGVAAESQVNDLALATAFHLDDISNGTGLATATDTDTVECDPFGKGGNPVADIIWVVDESGSMDDNRKDIVNNAKDFFSRALKAGLDFRMGVAGVQSPEPLPIPVPGLPTPPKVTVGKLCGKEMPPHNPNPFTVTYDDGGPDRFLFPNEQKVFETCIDNPPYDEEGAEYGLAHAFEGVTRHLPRTAGHMARIRPDATLVIIIATDEAPQELKSGSSYMGKTGFLQEDDFLGGNAAACTLSAAKQKKVNDHLKPWLDLFLGKDPKWGAQGKAMVHLIGGLCNSSCGSASMPDIAHGYLELVQATGGITADVCQKDLGASLQLIVDSIAGAASPMVLEYVPISASVAVAIDNQQLTRSRVKGFDYVGSSNSIVLVDTPLGDSSQVVASYRRWVKQADIK